MENSSNCKMYKDLSNVGLGKASQAGDKAITEFVAHQSRMEEIFCSGDFDVKSCFMASPSMAQVRYQKREEALKVSKRSQLVIGCQITSYSRVTLDRYLRLLIKHSQIPLYSDTDSAIYYKLRESPEVLPFHNSVYGFFKSEVSEHMEISMFCGLSNKNYALELVCPTTGKVLERILKIRGLTMSSKNVTDQMNLGVMLDMIRSLQDGKLAKKRLSQFRISIDGVTRQLSAKTVTSLYTNFSNTKRYFAPKISKTIMYPYGTTSYDGYN